MSLKWISRSPIDNKPALIKGMAWRRNLNRSSIVFLQENSFQNIVCQNGGHFSRGRWVKWCRWPEHYMRDGRLNNCIHAIKLLVLDTIHKECHRLQVYKCCVGAQRSESFDVFVTLVDPMMILRHSPEQHHAPEYWIPTIRNIMMTSSNGNIFRVAGH